MTLAEVVELIDAAVTASADGVSQPPAVTDWLISGLLEHIHTGERLDAALGLSVRAGHGRAPRTQWVMSARRKRIAEAWTKFCYVKSDPTLRDFAEVLYRFERERLPFWSSCGAADDSLPGALYRVCALGPLPRSRRIIHDIVKTTRHEMSCGTAHAKRIDIKSIVSILVRHRAELREILDAQRAEVLEILRETGDD